MRTEVGEWLATCVGSPICILLLSWSLLIYQDQPSSSKRRIDVLTVAILLESLVHQLGLLLYAILTLILPINNFSEICSTLVWLLNSTSILQDLTLASIAIFLVISSREEVPTLTKNHLKYHLVSLSVISACVGMTGVLNFEPEVCVFLPHEMSAKYGVFVNSLRIFLILTTVCSLVYAFFRRICRSGRSELLKSVSDLSETSSKNSSGAFDCHTHHWDHHSNGSYTSGSMNSRTCLKRKSAQVDEASGRSTVFSILFVCYFFDRIPILVVSLKPDLLRGFCTPENLAAWLPLLKDTVLPVFLAIFDKMFCRYVAKVYTKQDHARLSHGGIDGKFRHFEQDNEYKLQLNLNHGLKFPLTNGSLYGRLHTHQNRGVALARSGTITMGIQHYPRSPRMNEDTIYSFAPDLAAFTTSSFEPRHDSRIIELSKKTSLNEQQSRWNRQQDSMNDFVINRRKIGSTDVFGQNMENLVQLEDPKAKRKSNKDFLFGRELFIKKDQQLTDRHEEQIEVGYETSDDESYDMNSGDFDTMSSCRSISRSCCSVTTVANDDFEYFQRKGTKVELLPAKRMNESNKTSMRSFTPKIIENETTEVIGKSDSKPTVQRYHFKKRMSPGFLSMSDLDKMNAGKKPVVPTLSMESLRNILKNSDVSYLDNGEICRHDIGGSAPDLKKIFITEFI